VKNDLEAIAKNIIWLNLSNNELTEKDLESLGLMSNLEKLRLENNPITDKIIPLILSLKHLESINLNETNLSNTAIEKLKQNPSIKRVYQWNLVSR
jgi:Leucine-rich repeat (LRR) protein